jgi:hypothetical protein
MNLAQLMHNPWHRPDVPVRQQESRRFFMSSFNFDAVRSFAVAGVAALYTSLMLAAAMGVNGAEIGRLVV